jgi:hypothetical protein
VNQREYHLQVVGTAIAFIGVLGALAGGTVAYLDYSKKAELGALRALHDAQLATCREASQASARLFSVTEQQEFDAALTSFGEIKHGTALTLLDKSVLDRMVDVYNLGVNVKSKERGQAFQSEVRRALEGKPFLVALECRKMLARGFKDEAGTKIQSLEDEYALSWVPSSPK